MLTSVVNTFTDPDDYIASMQGATAEVVISRPGSFSAKLTRIRLHRLWMQRYAESLPRVAHFATDPDRAIIAFSTQAGPAPRWGTAEMPPTLMIRHSAGHSFFHRLVAPSSLGSMSLPLADMEGLGAAFGGTDFMPPRDMMLVVPPPAAMERLQRLHAAAGHLAESAPDVIACPDAAHGLEQALLAAMADCLGTTDGRLSGRGNGRHSAIMRRFYAVLEAQPDGVIHVPEICRLIGISNRTLSTCCNEALGMSPHRYLKLRQMHLARRALAQADPAVATVTRIATNHGFWELGRFAVAYRTLFGEPPSKTLARPPDAAPSPLPQRDFPAASKSA